MTSTKWFSILFPLDTHDAFALSIAFSKFLHSEYPIQWPNNIEDDQTTDGDIQESMDIPSSFGRDD
ncbi:MAG: hypothetical protein AB2660_03390 [Candidatus Thiodiazotropha sp.]